MRAGVAAAVIVLAACGDSAAPIASSLATTPPIDHARELAEFDHGPGVADEVVAPYASEFGRLSAKCGDAPADLAAILIDSQDDFELAGIERNLLVVLNDINVRVPDGSFVGSCIDVVALYIMCADDSTQSLC